MIRPGAIAIRLCRMATVRGFRPQGEVGQFEILDELAIRLPRHIDLGDRDLRDECQGDRGDHKSDQQPESEKRPGCLSQQKKDK